MLKISKYFKVTIVIFFIILIGSTLLLERNKRIEINKNASSIINIEQKIKQVQDNEDLKTKELDASKVMIESLKQSVSYLENEIKNLNISNSVDSEKFEHLLKKMPQISKKMAFIKQIGEKDGTAYAILDYVEMLGGEEASKSYMEDTQATKSEADAFVASFTNGYYIRNKQVEQDKVQIEKDALFYGIYTDQGLKLTYMHYLDFIKYTQSNKDPLFWCYTIGNKIVYMTEQYRP